MLLTSSASFMLPRVTIVLQVLLIVTVVCAHEISGSVLGKGGRNSLRARSSSQEFIAPVNDNNTYRPLHRKITNVMRVRKVDFDVKDGGFQNPRENNKGNTDRPYVQKLHNVPSGPNPIGNFDPPAQIDGLRAPSRH